MRSVTEVERSDTGQRFNELGADACRQRALDVAVRGAAYQNVAVCIAQQATGDAAKERAPDQAAAPGANCDEIDLGQA